MTPSKRYSARLSSEGFNNTGAAQIKKREDTGTLSR
jgi:hypothetical protein